MVIIYKHVPFEIKAIKETAEQAKFNFEGYASTFDLDLEDDRILPEAFKESLVENMPKLLWGHNPHEPAIGTIDFAKEDGKGLFIKASMPSEDSFVRGRIVPQMKHGSVNTMSIGFNILESEIVESEEDAKAKGFRVSLNIEKVTRLISKVKLYEVSLVNFPANPQAVVTELQKMLNLYQGKTEVKVKAVTPWASLPKTLASRDRRWDADAAVKRWRKQSGSEEKPSKSYKNNFLWYDRENEDNFGSYKLPIGDVLDETQKAIPRGIFAARAAIAGARGGVNIPEADMDSVKANINRYYEKMALDKPFGGKSLWSEAEIKNLSAGDLSRLLRSKEQLSRNATDYIASCLVSMQDKKGNHAGEVKQDIYIENSINMLKEFRKSLSKE